MDHRVLIVFLSVWSSGLSAEDAHSSTGVSGDVRLVGGASRCSGTLEEKHQGGWEAVNDQNDDWNLTSAAVVCRRLSCGSAVSLRRKRKSSDVLELFHRVYTQFDSLGSDEVSSSSLEINCLDSVRLVDGTTRCSGRLEMKSNQSTQWWSPVCHHDFTQRDAEVVCRELGCGAPSILQGALFGEAEAPIWTEEFQCGGHESALLDCRSSVRPTCPSGRAVVVTCSEPGDVRLVGGDGRCRGTLEVNKQGEWRAVDHGDWNLRSADVVCRQLDCGSAVSTRGGTKTSHSYVWGILSDCRSSSLQKCLTGPISSSAVLEITCSDSVRLTNGTSLCSGRLEVKSNQSTQSTQSWSSVCGDDFTQRDAEVVCRELGCGAPSAFKGGLHGEVEAPVWMRKLRCDGHESSLLDCRSSGSAGSTCSSGRAVGLTCSDPDDVRLAGGASRCTGRLELKHHEKWRAVDFMDWDDWDVNVTSGICRRLDCGSFVSSWKKTGSAEGSVWWISSSCVRSKSTLQECVTARVDLSYSSLEITCLDSVRLVNGTSLCSGRLEVKSNQSNQSNQSWSSVCEDDFDLQDAKVVCRELGCGAPSGLQGALYGEAETPVWTKEFQCEGNESALLGCGGSGSARDVCSPGKAVGLTCSDPHYIRLAGEASCCAGVLEIKNQEEWRPAADWFSQWDQESAAAVCRLLDCGSAVSSKMADDYVLVWAIKFSCVPSASMLLECLIPTEYDETYNGLEVICSDLLAQPNISPTPSIYAAVSGAKQQGPHVLVGSDFTITCSIEPQYPGGSFQLVFTSSDAAENRTLPAVNHSARFPFFAADRTHQGDYRCVYHVYVFSHNFSSESQSLHLTVSAPLSELIIRLVVILLGLMILITVLHFHSKNPHAGRRVQR